MNICSNCQSHFFEEHCPHCDSTEVNVKKGGNLALGLLLGVGLVACQGGQALYGVPITEEDLDGDGYTNLVDCDDQDPYTYPGAAFEDSETECMTDFDGDGYGDANLDESSWAEPGTDCDDSDPTVNPGNENCEE